MPEKKKPLSRRQRWIRGSAWSLLSMLLLLLISGALCYTGVIWPNKLFVQAYSVRGIDVSSYQQRIDWQSVAQSGEYAFAYIKATEGTDYRDTSFQANWRGASASGLLRGAYHYFTADQSGLEQANNYISVVPREAGMLPPMLDLEVNGGNHAVMLREIGIFLARLKQYYGITPLIYTDHERYTEYIQGNFTTYPLTIRDVITPVQWSPIRAWTFWQYDDRGHVPGITGYVDLDAFSGRRAQLDALSGSSGSGLR